MTSSSRRAFTLVELLIVIAIIGVLMGLLLPAIQAARERARQAACSNNVGQLAKAMQNYATSGKQVFPGWADYQKVADNDPDVVTVLPVTWAAKLLGQLDQEATRSQMLDNNGTFDYDNPPRLDVFICPSDVQLNEEIAALTYVVNTGIPDLLDSGPLGNDPGDIKANGVCHDLRPGRKGETVRIGADIKDGATSTLLLAENVHKNETTWLGPVNDNMGLVNSTAQASMGQNPEQRFGMVWGGSADPNKWPGGLESIGRDSSEGTADYSSPGEDLRYARPASEHPDVFVAAFCGSNVKEISNDIDYRVYQQLMTPNGAKAFDRLVGPDFNPLDFMSPPLADGDY